MMRGLILGGLAAAALAVSPSIAAEDLNAFRTLSGSEISFSLGGAYSNATLTVVGPGGFMARDYSRTGNPAIDLIRSKAKTDGLYNYEITAASSDTVAITGNVDNGRGGADTGEMKRAVSATGSFEVKGGLVVDMSGQAESEE